MADLIFSRSRQQMMGSGFAGLLGLFAGLCAIFAVFITLSDWHQEITQARWPVVSAVVDRADVVASVRAPKHGGGTEWKLRYRLRYELNGEARMATLTSPAVFSETEAAKLQSWAAQHRKGSQIDIRYDASRDNRAVFASAEISYGADRTGTDILLFAAAVVGCAGLLALARYLRVREAFTAQVANYNGASGGGLAAGIGCAAVGLMLVGFTIHAAIHADPFTADNLMAVPAGLMFVFAGILIGLPPEYNKWRNLLATLLVTLLRADLRLGCLRTRRTQVQRQHRWYRVYTWRVSRPGCFRRRRCCSRSLRHRDVDRPMSESVQMVDKRWSHY